MTRRPAVEWPTVIVAVAAHGLWLAALAIHRHVPAVVTVAALAIAIAWHSSLQHEVIHGHPFRRRALNDCLASLPLSIAVPYALYRHLHLAHHAAARLTDPIEDSESFYIGASDWARLPRTCRALLVVNQTLLGRIVFGPAISLWRFFRSQFDAVVRRGHRTLARWWLAHLALVAGLAVFVVGVCRVSPWQYALGVYLAHSLVLVRSFSEHYYTDGGASRSAIVPAGRFFSLL